LSKPTTPPRPDTLPPYLPDRLMTFVDWPFLEDCLCTPEMMARAGFVHCPSENKPDVVRCFFCLTELVGWEPQDNPWLEHSKHNPKCGFLQLKKDYKELLTLFQIDKIHKSPRQQQAAVPEKNGKAELSELKDDGRVSGGKMRPSSYFRLLDNTTLCQ
uniref:Uncharacterized protein n=1 Tax=Erpetoichthys calabaricus TaxID=27687 RepID=A0A8C4S5B1_ERPCA